MSEFQYREKRRVLESTEKAADNSETILDVLHSISEQFSEFSRRIDILEKAIADPKSEAARELSKKHGTKAFVHK